MCILLDMANNHYKRRCRSVITQVLVIVGEENMVNLTVICVLAVCLMSSASLVAGC